MTEDFEVTSNTETPEEVQLSLKLGEDEPGEAKAEPKKVEPEPQADGDGGEEEDLGKYSAKEIHDNPRLRIKKATAEAAAAKREAEEAKSRLVAYEAELAKLRQSAPKGDDKEPQEEDFDTYKDYVKAQSRWEARQEYEARQKEAAEAHRRAEIERARVSRETGHSERLIARGGKAFIDTLSEDVVNIPTDTPLGYAVSESELGPDIMVYLSKHPDELRALSSMHPAYVYREIGRIEGKLERVDVTASAPRVSVSKAKPPVRPVAGTPSVGDELPEDASFEEYFRHENARERARTH